jgi:hypothetical protein
MPIGGREDIKKLRKTMEGLNIRDNPKNKR